VEPKGYREEKRRSSPDSIRGRCDHIDSLSDRSIPTVRRVINKLSWKRIVRSFEFDEKHTGGNASRRYHDNSLIQLDLQVLGLIPRRAVLKNAPPTNDPTPNSRHSPSPSPSDSLGALVKSARPPQFRILLFLMQIGLSATLQIISRVSLAWF
jgi:hypothetical protein